MIDAREARPEEYPEFSRQPIEIQEDGVDFDSTNVHSLLYDFGESELVARFYRDGADALYQYSGFPASEWQGLAEASSKGGYINRNIVGVYTGFTKLRKSKWPGGIRSIDVPRARHFVMKGIITKQAANQ